jgi:hypothetical protein
MIGNPLTLIRRIRMKRVTIIGLVVGLMTIFLAVTISYAAPPAPKQPLVQQAPVKPIIPKPRTDLKVDAIHSHRCKCDLSDVDAFYMGNIMVNVSNNYMQSGGVSTTATLTVTYHDLSSGGPVTVTKNIPTLNPYPTNPWALQNFVVVDHPVLVKRSGGIRAEIQPTGIVVDSNPANNIMIVRDCSVVVY